MSKALFLLACSLAAAQSQPTHMKSAPEQLGYPAGTKLLIIHADDLAVAHSADRASFAALDQGAVSSASIMVPCPWLTEVAGYAKQHPNADLGLHLTFTAEWKNYRWGPVARGNLGGLIAPDGYFYSGVPPVVKNAKPAEIEAELRAQIDRAVAMGIHPTHLDSHMGTLFTPEFFPVYVKVAREYGIPFFAPRQVLGSAAMRDVLKDSDILVDAVIMANESVKPENWKAFYIQAIESLKPGLSEIIVHLGHDDAELQAVMEDHPAYGSPWRQRDFDVMTSPEFRKALDANHITVIGWKPAK